MKCPICSEDNLEGAAYCEQCGGKLPAGIYEQPVQIQGDTIRCSICERVNPATAEYCEDCGNALGEAQTSLESAEAPPSQRASVAPPQESYSRLALASGGKSLSLTWM